MNETLFPEYEDIKPILQIGSYFIGKYKKRKEEMSDFSYDVLNKNLKELKKVSKRGITNERQSVLKEIQTEMEKDGKVNVKLLAIRLSHIPTEDLYFMLSEAKDYRKRGKGEFSKYIWGSVKVKKLSTV